MSKQGNIRVRKNSGVIVGTRRLLNLTEGANVTLTVTDSGPNDEIVIDIASAAAGGTIVVRKNSGADVGTRPRLNFIEGGNVTLTIADDGPGNEIDITIAAAAAGADALARFFPIVETDSNKGTYTAALMLDGIDTLVRQTFVIPAAITLPVVSASVILIAENTGQLRRSVAANFASLCADEGFQTHTVSIAVGEVAVTDDEVECIDITGALAAAVGGDIVGMEFTRHGSHGNDTVNADVYYLGVYVKGSVPE